MKNMGVIRKVDQKGRIITPVGLRETFDISPEDLLEVFLEENKIVLRKYKVNGACIITGEISDENIESNHIKGLYLSPKGAELLLEELQRNLHR